MKHFLSNKQVAFLQKAQTDYHSKANEPTSTEKTEETKRIAEALNQEIMNTLVKFIKDNPIKPTQDRARINNL